MEQDSNMESGDEYLITEAELRSAMRCYVEGVDAIVLPVLADSPSTHQTQVIKAEMHRIVSDMDLAFEMRLSSTLHSCLAQMPRAFRQPLETHCQHDAQLQYGVNMSTHNMLPAADHRLQLPCSRSQPEENVRCLHCSCRSKIKEIALQHLVNALYPFLNGMLGDQLIHVLFNVQKIANIGVDKAVQDLTDNELVAQIKAEGDLARAQFVKKVELQPPKVMRVINIEATCLCDLVVLEEWPLGEGESSYTAISHTRGMDVYEAFDCACASVCLSKDIPRCSEKACAHQDGDPATADATDKQKKVVKDILNMCGILQKAGVKYAWHDGVCIAQHNKAEVQETIKSMGWIYSSAADTIVFLDYVGRPVAPISNDDAQPTCRWHTRVWTVQETALSRSRRYCVRVGDSPLGDCQSLEEVEQKVDLWYRDDSSKVKIIHEERFFEMLKEIVLVLVPLINKLGEMSTPKYSEKLFCWLKSTCQLAFDLAGIGIDFPTRLCKVLQICCHRETKHEGDRINSILTLAGVKNFVAEKDVGLEDSAIEFFNRQGHEGLATALLSTSNFQSIMSDAEVRRHTWVPTLRGLNSANFIDADWKDLNMQLKVLEDGNLEVTGKGLVCVRTRFTLRRGDQNNWSRRQHHVKIQRGLAALEVELTRMPQQQGQYGCSLPQAPEFFIGSAHMQMIFTIPPQPVLADGGRVREGDSFEAYLVLTMEKLLQASPGSIHKPSTSKDPCPPFTVIHPDDDQSGLGVQVHINSPHSPEFSSCPLLLVQGELPLVSKIGRFRPRDSFYQLLLPLLLSPWVTILNKLTVR